MAAMEVTISGLLYDKLARTTQQVALIGEMTYTGLGVGGGPIIPPPDRPPVIDPPPIITPPPNPNPPVQPGDPPMLVPPPAGSPGWPVNPMVAPDYIIVQYPGVGPVYVAKPLPPPVPA